jgi:nicotinamide mononucleotide transporter
VLGCSEAVSWLEWLAFLTGVVSVYLSTRENVWSWPAGIVNVSLYFLLFRRAGLYSDMGLQLVYLALSIYGWYEWLFGGANRTELRVSRATPRLWISALVVGVLFWFALSWFTSRLQGVALPRLDAALTTISLVAQWWMTRKVLENWVLWIVADLVYVPMFLYKHLCLTAGLYAVFFVLAIMGYVQWRRSWRASPA